MELIIILITLRKGWNLIVNEEMEYYHFIIDLIKFLWTDWIYYLMKRRNIIN